MDVEAGNVEPRGTRDLLERVKHDERVRGRAQLVVALVVAMDDEPLVRDAGAERELQLAPGRDVRTDTEPGEQPQDRDVRERLGAVDDLCIWRGLAVRPYARADRLLAVNDERRVVLGGERLDGDTADRQVAASDGRR